MRTSSSSISSSGSSNTSSSSSSSSMLFAGEDLINNSFGGGSPCSSTNGALSQTGVEMFILEVSIELDSSSVGARPQDCRMFSLSTSRL